MSELDRYFQEFDLEYKWADIKDDISIQDLLKWLKEKDIPLSKVVIQSSGDPWCPASVSWRS